MIENEVLGCVRSDNNFSSFGVLRLVRCCRLVVDVVVANAMCCNATDELFDWGLCVVVIVMMLQ